MGSSRSNYGDFDSCGDKIRRQLKWDFEFKSEFKI